MYTLAEAAACTAPIAAVGSKRASSDLEDTLDAAVVSSSPLLRRATTNRGFRVGFRGRWGGAPVGRAVRQVQGRIWREGWSWELQQSRGGVCVLCLLGPGIPGNLGIWPTACLFSAASGARG